MFEWRHEDGAEAAGGGDRINVQDKDGFNADLGERERPWEGGGEAVGWLQL